MVGNADGSRGLSGRRKPGLWVEHPWLTNVQKGGSWVRCQHRDGVGAGVATQCPVCMRTDLLGAKLLVPDAGTQQGPEGVEELPPRPVLDRQEHGHVLLDAPRGQAADLRGEGMGNGGSCPAWRR